LQACERLLRQCVPDTVHLQYPGLGFERGVTPTFLLSYLAWRMPTCRRVITLHEYAMFTWRGKLRLWPALTDTHAVICTNHADRRALRRFAQHVQPVRVIPLGSAINPEDVPPEVFPAPTPGEQTWVHFGSVMPNKGWEILLQAWASLQTLGPARYLDVFAELEPDKYATHRAVDLLRRTLGLASRVVFRGYLPTAEIHAALRVSSGLAVLPFSEGARLNRSSLVALLNAGLAVVSTCPSAPLEGLRHGENIWYAAPGDLETLLAGLARVAQDAELAQRLQAGARRVAGRFAWKRIAGQHAKLYTL
jgi:glycosyltransferase involved in cell wall biosynthesis